MHCSEGMHASSAGGDRRILAGHGRWLILCCACIVQFGSYYAYTRMKLSGVHYACGVHHDSFSMDAGRMVDMYMYVSVAFH